jgi:mono/diheme cytochrome c family protein
MKTWSLLKFVCRGHSCPRCMQERLGLAGKSARATLPLRWRGLMRLAGICAVACCVSLMSAQREDAVSKRRGRSSYAALAEVPDAARMRKNPFAGDSQEGMAGGKLFEQHCADCHGPKAGGTRRGPSLLVEEVQQATPGTLFWILTNGVVRRGMPVWSKLPEPERWQILTFLQSLNSNAPKPASNP